MKKKISASITGVYIFKWSSGKHVHHEHKHGHGHKHGHHHQNHHHHHHTGHHGHGHHHDDDHDDHHEHSGKNKASDTSKTAATITGSADGKGPVAIVLHGSQAGNLLKTVLEQQKKSNVPKSLPTHSSVPPRQNGYAELARSGQMGQMGQYGGMGSPMLGMGMGGMPGMPGMPGMGAMPPMYY